MKPIKVGRHIGPHGNGDILADLSENSENGIINIWINYDKAEHKPTLNITPEKWDRLVAWVECQRKGGADEEDK